MDRRRVGRRKRRPANLDDVIYGQHAVAEALEAGEALAHIHIGADRGREAAVRRLIDRAGSLQIPLRFEDRSYFAQFPYKAHQSIVAFGPPFSYATVDEVVHAKRDQPLLIVVLDHITDPHNVGAIIRTAEGAGAHGVIVPDRRAAGVNPTVRKAAAGASAHLAVARVTNVAQTLRMLKKSGTWIFGADAPARANHTPASLPYTQADWQRDLALVIGAEGEGLSALARRECDYLVHIPMLGKINSLNASVAAAILLYEAVRQRAPRQAISR